jgi:subtilase family serine protease
MDTQKRLLRNTSAQLAAGVILCCSALHGFSQPLSERSSQASAPAQSPAQSTAQSESDTVLEQTAERAPRIVDSIDDTQLVTLKGNTHPLARAKYDAGAVSPDLLMGDLVLVLRRSPETQAAFDHFVAAQYDVKSKSYHQWLTAAQIGEEFGPAQSDITAISNWLTGHGFTIDEVAKDRLSIRFSGAASAVQSAFHTEIHNLDVKGEKHIANMADPQIPSALAPVFAGVKALHNFFPHPLHRLGGQVTLNRQSGNWQRVGTPHSIPTKQSGTEAPTGVRPDFGTANGYGDAVEDVTPYDFATIYNVLPLWTAASPIDGTGQTVAIAGTSNINLADVAAFRSAFGLPVKAPTVTITNSDPGDCPGFDSSCADGLVENTLDVEWAGAVAKGANIMLVTSSAPTPTSDPLYLSESYIVQNNAAKIMNVSYGSCEVVLGNAGNIEYNNLWQTAAGEGIAVFVASGDAGSPACDQDFDQTDGVPYAAQFGLSVNGITSTPFNTSVGGTDFNWGATAAPYWSTSNSSTTSASALGYIPEVPWNQTCSNPLVLPELQTDAAYVGVTGVVDAESACNFVIESWSYLNTNYQVNLAGLVDTVGGGGGASNCILSNLGSPESCSGGYAKPTWQAGVQGIPADAARDIPDVSFFASDGFLGSAYLICVSGGGNACTYSATSEPTAQEVGGTSVASPAMAGIMALINQKSGASQGDPNTVLYELAAKEAYAGCSAETAKTTSTCVFNDIDTGTNAMPCSAAGYECYPIYSGDPLGILGGFAAGTGYDEATGLGSLNVANVVNSWPAVAAFVSLSSTSLTFASTAEGHASATQTIMLTNTGKVALSLNGTGQGISITGTNASSFTQTNTCGTSVAAAATCKITVTFDPAATGTLTAKVSIADNTYGSPQTVTLNGTGTATVPAVTLSANSLSFSSQPVGNSYTAPNITLTNSGTAALSITSISITGANASSFSETNTCGTTVAIGATCTIAITFKPAAPTSLSAALSVADNAPGSPQTVALSGTGTGNGGVGLAPDSLTFPTTPINIAAPTQTITLTNNGNASLTISSITIGGTYYTSYSETNNCGTILPESSSCVITVTFKPTTSGVLPAYVKIADNATGSPQEVPLTGAGTPVSLSAGSLTYASTGVGTAAPTQAITLTNKGSTALTFSSIAISGTNASSFSQTNTCGTTIASGHACAITVTFKPTATGNLLASVSIADNGYGSPQTISLSGAGINIGITLSATSLTFPTTLIGTAAPTKTITLTNDGSNALAVSGISISGTYFTSFSQTNTCGTSVASAASCVITVTFKPSAAGALTASVRIADNGPGSPQMVALSGGSTPVSLSATSLTYPSTGLGVAAATQAITLTNKGTTALTFASIGITGTDASSFSQTNTCGTSVAAGGSCVITVTFTPAALGALTAAVNIADSGYGSPEKISLSGTGSTVGLSPSSLTFPGTLVGATAPARTITLSNKGSAALSLTGITVTGTYFTSFSQTNNCGTSVAVGASCAITVTFKPTTAGALTASIKIADNASGSPQMVPLSGGSSAVSLSASTLAFPLTTIGVAASTQQITVSNTSNAAISVTGVAITGTDPSSFSQTNTCGASLAGHSSCVITVTFKPAAVGALAAGVGITDSSYGSPQTVTLSGAGTPVGLSTASLTFPSTAVGVSSSTQQITLTNKGSTALSVTGIDMTGTYFTSFSQTNTCGSSVAAGDSCAIIVTFKPTKAGTLTAGVKITSTGYGSPQEIALTGTGQ